MKYSTVARTLTGRATVCQTWSTPFGTYCEVVFESPMPCGNLPRPWLFVGQHQISKGDTIVALQDSCGIKHYKMIGQTRLELIERCRLSKNPLLQP